METGGRGLPGGGFCCLMKISGKGRGEQEALGCLEAALVEGGKKKSHFEYVSIRSNLGEPNIFQHRHSLAQPWERIKIDGTEKNPDSDTLW